MTAGNNIPCLDELNCNIFQEIRTNQTKAACNVFCLSSAAAKEFPVPKLKKTPGVLRPRPRHAAAH